MSTPFLKELLLITNPNVISLASYLNKTALLFILPCFYIAIICEYLTNWDFKSVIKRSFIAFLAIKLLTPLHISFVNEALVTSSELVKRYSPQNKFLTAYNTTRMDKKAGVWKKLSSIVEMIVTDPIVLIIFLLSYISFFLLTQLYSLVYHLEIVLIGLCALLSIFPITSRSLAGALKASLWCMLLPFVVAIVLCLIGDSDAFLKTYSGGIVNNLESLIQLLIMTVILLMTPVITSKIMSDTGVTGVADNISQMASMGALVGGSGFLMAQASKGMNQAHKLTTKPLMNFGKGAVSKSASEVMEKKGIAPKVSDSFDEGIGAKLKNKTEGLKNALGNTSFSEKFLLGADALANRKENQLAQKARVSDLKSLGENQENGDKLLPLSGYKKEARAFLKKNQYQPQNATPSNFEDFRKNHSPSQRLNRPLESGAFHFNQAQWQQLPPMEKKEAQKTFGFNHPKENFIYFPKEMNRSPLPVSLYNKMMKPKTIKELRDEKFFLD